MAPTTTSHLLLKTPTFQKQTEELEFLLRRVEHIVWQSRQDYRNSLVPSLQQTSPEKGIGRLFSRRSKADSASKQNEPQQQQQQHRTHQNPAASKDTAAQFFPMAYAETLIEDLRRISELVVVGENYVTSQIKKQQEKVLREKEQWRQKRDVLETSLEYTGELGETSDEQERNIDHAQLFDRFFEENALETIVNILNGRALQIQELEDSERPEHMQQEEWGKCVDTIKRAACTTYLPPITVATQAIQSISILVQNVSRVTSLYVILSNNHINELIHLPLSTYEAALKAKTNTTTTFQSPELAELTTHFITLMKSLALRMNAETLQFFLTYPQPKRVEFPLYERALEFCAAHQESFIRVTAMNICLNTLRLTTVAPSPDNEVSNDDTEPSASSPEGVLHHAKALPFRERVAIASYACSPLRVERLIAPIFTILAERWNVLDEQMRQLDEVASSVPGSPTRNEKVAKAKEKVKRERLMRKFKDCAADLQDELLLLEDVFKVGLTVLNEQLIEMMLATFVYPLLLQPLLLFYQRYTAVVDPKQEGPVNSPFGKHGDDYSRAISALKPVIGPAKTSLFTIASVFHFLTNKPLLRLLFAAILHPLSPDSTSAPTVRSTLEVAATDPNGNDTIRLDVYGAGDERSSYAFGTIPGNRRLVRLGNHCLENLEGTEACVFVLAPALAEVLEFRGQDVALITRTRPNPYRRAILECLDLPSELAQLQRICTCMIDAALSTMDSHFVAEIIFGTDLKTFTDDVPTDERTLESAKAHFLDDRGIGGGVSYESRHALSRKQGGSIGANLIGEMVSALVASTLTAYRQVEYRLNFNQGAADALLCAIRSNSRALLYARKSTETRFRQATAYLSLIPPKLYSKATGSMIYMPGAPYVNVKNYNEKMYGGVINCFVFDCPDDPNQVPLVEEFKTLSEVSKKNEWDGASLVVSNRTTFNDMCDCIGDILFIGLEDIAPDVPEILTCARASARAIFQTEALLSLLKDFASAGGVSMQKVDLVGAALTKDGNYVDLKKSFILDFSRCLYAPISDDLSSFLFGHGVDPEREIKIFKSGDVIDLVGSPAIPCVCEAPAAFSHFFTDESGIVAEGITWQSMYLVFLRGYLILAQPHLGDSSKGGQGRVISSCHLERLSVERDKVPQASSARRLIFTHKWFDLQPPPLFLFDDIPKPKEQGPFVLIKPYESRLDVWFEDGKVSDHAIQSLSAQIFAAKSMRGHRLQKFLSPTTQTSTI